MSQTDAQARHTAQTDTPCALQTATFANALLDPDLPIPQGVGRNGHKAPKRFSIYRNNVVVGLMDALKAAYPSIVVIMGEENFDRVARNFILHHPPSSPMMQKYGSGFPAFLENFKPLRNSPFLVDVAKAERAWLDAWHAVDEPALCPEELGAIAPDATMELVFTTLRATTLIESDYPVHTLFNARHSWPAPGIDLGESQALLITRPGLECITTLLDAPGQTFFRQLISGRTLSASLGEALALDEEFDPANAIALMLQTGAFAALDGG